jgi:ABC-2 type transport system ATP-binding protein
VVGRKEISDLKIVETNTDEIVREIYQSGSAAKRPEGAGKQPDGAAEAKEPSLTGSERL